jgi:hypothetical protein
MTESEYKTLAHKWGVEFVGIQKWSYKEFPMFRFKDECSQTSFCLNEGESLEQAIERKRKEFSQQ